MSKWRRFAGLFALMAALTFALAACGGGDDEGAGATTEAGGGTTEKTFPEFKIAFDKAIDSANAWHEEKDKAFIRWKLPEMPPPDLDLTPRKKS